MIPSAEDAGTGLSDAFFFCTEGIQLNISKGEMVDLFALVKAEEWVEGCTAVIWELYPYRCVAQQGFDQGVGVCK